MRPTGAFDYLVILLSIVLGLSMTSVLSGFARLIDARERVRFHPLSIFWATWVFFVCVQHWWAKYSLQRLAHWTFGAFALELLTPVGLFIASALVLPQTIAGPTDLREWFVKNRRWFFATVTMLPLASTASDVANGGYRADANHILLGLAAILLASGFFVADMRWHYALAAVTALLTTFYIFALFGGLPTT